MDETNTTNTENSKPHDAEPSSRKNENEHISTRLSPPIENLLNSIENPTDTMLQCTDTKSDNQSFVAESELNDESKTSQVDNQSTDAMMSAQEEPPDDPGETSQKSQDDQKSKEKFDTTACLDNEIKNTEDETQNQSLIDDSEDLLVPTSFVPDSEDIISDEPKRKHSICSELSSEMCKKFKRDPLADEDMSMQTECTEDDFDEMCTNESEEQPSQNSHEKLTVTDNVEMIEKCKISNDELNINEILTKKICSEKTIALADIIDSVDDLIKKDDEQSETNNSDLVDEKQTDDTCSKIMEDDTEKNSVSEELDFDISEKLKDMGEISLGPVSKTDRKTLPDFELGAEVSLEQICKKGATDGDDKRNKVSNLRKNIREVMDDNQLDASTLAAQREELERLARVQDQQRMIREMQRQVALDRQNSKTQSKVLSLLTGHTSLLKSSNAGASSKSQATSPTISSDDVEDILSGKSGNLTPSVSIAPIKTPRKKSESIEILDVSSGIEMHNEADTDSSEKFEKSTDDLLIVEDEEELTEEEDEDDDDDVIELKPKKDIVTIDDSSDDDCIM